jgi:hypothetical protein
MLQTSVETINTPRTFLTTQPTQNLRPRTQLTNRVVLQGFLCKCNTGVDSMAGCPTLLIYACNGMQPSRDLRRLPSCPGHRFRGTPS